ncbi:MAG: phosphohistidine phosphatase SixA [bacterium]
MNLYLVRHGEAQEAPDDSSRELTERGKADVEKVASYAARFHVRIARIFHSGKMRSFQTAQIFSDHLMPEGQISATEGLSPMDDPEIWSQKLSGMAEDILLVGHLPHLARLLSFLTCGEKERAVADFQPAAMACLKQSENKRWSISWIITPGMLS